ncbi:MAG: hypothetical protein MAG453_00162 [Calditrichaeota bacterium]|nr:hypothetical protein [Calditrichota bacterium]
MQRRIARIALVVAAALLSACPVSPLAQKSDTSPDQPGSLLGGPFRLELRAGYTGTMWTPKGIEPYEVQTYGRNLLYGELALHHPLLILGRAFDVFDIPRLRVETNFGYSTASGGFQDLIPGAIRRNPYLRTTSWMTFFRWFSFRYRVERFNASVSDPRDWLADYGDSPTLRTPGEITNQMRDIEIGVIGSTDGEIHDTMIELGYFHSALQWPIVERAWNGLDDVDFLVQREVSAEGMYLSLNTTPIEGVWPMYSQFIVRWGGAFGLDARFKYEHELIRRWSIGLELDASWRLLNGYEDELDTQVEIKNNNPRDTRYRLTLYTVFVVL